MPTQPLGWYKKPITKVEDFKGLKFRTVGLAIDMFTGDGAAVNALPGGEIVPALDRGLIDGAEFNNATSDRLLGFPDVSKVCMLQSFHQTPSSSRSCSTRPSTTRCRQKLKAIIDYAVEAACADMSGKRSTDIRRTTSTCSTKDKVKFYKTPDAILQQAARDLGQGRSRRRRTENAAVQEGARFAEGIRRARVSLGFDYQRRLPHGLQPLLRTAGRTSQEGLTEVWA